jgi:hypothetical protein
MTDPLHQQQGYANLDNGQSYAGLLHVYPNWVFVETTDSQYAVPRDDVDFLNFKHVDDDLDDPQ